MVQDSVGVKVQMKVDSPSRHPAPHTALASTPLKLPEVAPSLPLSKRNRFDTCSRDGGQRVTQRIVMFIWMKDGKGT